MGFFDLFKKSGQKKATELWPAILGADADGTVIPMPEIPDEVFSTGVLGKCCGIDPSDGAVYAPATGTISQVADTLHAVGLELGGGIEILIHVGVDTVEMDGDGFTSKVKVGDKVQKGQLLLTMNLEKIKAAGHPAVVITAVTNSDDFSAIEVVSEGRVAHGADFMKIIK